MFKPILSATVIVMLSACAHQNGGNNSDSDAKDSPTRVDDAFNDGRCDDYAGRDPAGAPDCQGQQQQQQQQRRRGLANEELLNDGRIGDLDRELDRMPINLRRDELGL